MNHRCSVTSGFFFESFNHRQFAEDMGREVNFVQDNHCRSAKDVLRGLHYPVLRPQGKLVRVVHGEVFDVAINIRRSSPTFGQCVGGILSAENNKHIWIPEGFAHGFMVLSDTAEFLYKTTDYWVPEFERQHCVEHSAIDILWPIRHICVAVKRRTTGGIRISGVFRMTPPQIQSTLTPPSPPLLRHWAEASGATASSSRR